ncbi:MAG: hypothetical protein WBB07_01400 [Mycobacterium sp.]
MPTFVTRVKVTQVDDYQPPPEAIAEPAGYPAWVMEWTVVDQGREDSFRHALYAIADARRMTMNLLKERPPAHRAILQMACRVLV